MDDRYTPLLGRSRTENFRIRTNVTSGQGTIKTVPQRQAYGCRITSGSSLCASSILIQL
ncbi:hypothetical protein CGRA01v4_12590 [Colletotrichum graminicola]|nr:hypothetical protein CGRA01v4_12590 [Colletotrichum graminicola]